MTVDTQIMDVMTDPIFGDYGRLRSPVQGDYHSGETLGGLSWSYYSHIAPEKTLKMVNSLKDRAGAGETIFYDNLHRCRKSHQLGQGGHRPVFFQDENFIIGGEAAPVVKQIYSLCLAGNGPAKIARILAEQQIPMPETLEYHRTGSTRRCHPGYECKWATNTILSYA